MSDIATTLVQNEANQEKQAATIYCAENTDPYVYYAIGGGVAGLLLGAALTVYLILRCIGRAFSHF